MKKVWVVNANSESGDEFGPYVFDAKPTNKYLESFMKKVSPDDFPKDKGGCGKWGSWLFVALVECEVESLAKKNIEK